MNLNLIGISVAAVIIAFGFGYGEGHHQAAKACKEAALAAQLATVQADNSEKEKKLAEANSLAKELQDKNLTNEKRLKDIEKSRACPLSDADARRLRNIDSN